ncbi:MAG: transporter permease [Paenibacillaceae bacterium]|jgi:ABC-2 type transport system permease protein|nr:transporter permease [Paenibacillaceae bacterium]
MREDFADLWRKRAAAFWKEAFIYISYAARSGFAGFLLMFFIIGAYYYGKFLQSLPDGFPYWRMTTPILALALGMTGVRTFMKQADMVFLAPAESRLRSWWTCSVLYSFVFQAAVSLMLLLMVWPLYLACADEAALSFAHAAAYLLIAKLLAVVGRFYSDRLVYRLNRGAEALVRWLAAVVLPFALLTESPAKAWLLLLAAAVVQGLVILPFPRHRVPWEHLIRQEETSLKRHYTFYSWFADVPKLKSKPAARRLLGGITSRIPFRQEDTHRFLYAKTFIRSEHYAILVRTSLIAVLLFLAVNHTAAVLLIYGIVLIMNCATVSSLSQSHQYSFWLELYPLDAKRRGKAVSRICESALLLSNTVVGAALIGFHSNGRFQALAAVAAGFLYILYFTRVSLPRKIKNAGD